MIEEVSFLALGKSIIWVFDDAWHDWLYLPLLIDEQKIYAYLGRNGDLIRPQDKAPIFAKATRACDMIE